ncbi:LRR receptor-like serine/threonine-protein kinase FLS2 [Solanum stenotomum]|uniref:LRR receptor-like serine/threonine-protein kinase FLS2 n=1 Tax=Solanum stenotomum TaxID=172797 RepID=UPI0020D0C5E8|nr:LRR receptor-like serine/threonine-protein kinase FLS2 [Solanum stenotomum]
MSFLTSLSNYRNLRVLWIGDNLLDGVLPPSIGNLSKPLDSFDGSGCKLKDVIPQEIDNLTEMTSLNLFKNVLIGHIPITAHIMGPIPESFGKMLSLEYLDLSYNNLSGQIPKLDITIDVASAIDYLHNGYSTPVVHCDLKPKNVLIDHETVAHKLLAKQLASVFVKDGEGYALVADKRNFKGKSRDMLHSRSSGGSSSLGKKDEPSHYYGKKPPRFYDVVM